MRTIHGSADLPDDFAQHVPDNDGADAIAHAVVCVVTGALEAIVSINALEVIGAIRGATTHRKACALALAWALAWA
jgi:hypothetical protein